MLDMESCIAAMEDALAALARDELFLPLRFIMRPPAESMFGLMPAYRGGDDLVFSLKEIVVSPGTCTRPRPASGRRDPARRTDRPPPRGAQRVGGDGDPHCAVSAVATKRLPWSAPASSPSWGRACRDARTSRRCRRSSATRSCGSGAGTAYMRKRSRSSGTRLSAPRPRKPWTAPRSVHHDRPA